RSTASRSASGRMIASAIRNIFTLRRNASAMPGKSDVKRWPLKNVRCTSGQPGLFAIAKPRAVKTSAVLTRAMTTVRRPPPRDLSRPPRIFELRSSVGLAEDRNCDDLGQPGLVDLLERPVPLHHRKALVDAADERVALLEGHAEVLSGLAVEL